MDPISFKVEVMDRIYSVIKFYKQKNQDYLRKPICQKHNYFLNNIFNNLNNNFSIKRAVNILSFFAVNSKKLCQIDPSNQEVINLVSNYVSEINKMKKILRENHPEYFVLPPIGTEEENGVKVTWV
tara:strand:+ start:149 stop:526 length:378 start_codon:yes stop_codon:yes gene_type:complete